MYVMIFCVPTFRASLAAVTEGAKIIQKTKTKGDIIMEAIISIWEQFCSGFAAVMLVVFGIIGLIVIAGQIIKNKVL